MDANQPMTFGDARRIIIETLMQIRNGTMPASAGIDIVSNMKVVNDSVMTEINASN